ncbi:MAG: FecR domain-containing protein [Acidobacteriota bacterium]|nr:FecR domain-containing protein [Acidobacteriota bacterium]
MFARHVTEDLSAYAHGELTDARAARVGQHLLACARCRAAFEEIRLGIRLVESLPLREAPSAVWQGVEAALAAMPSQLDARTTRGGTFAEHFNFGPASWRRALVACSLLLAVGLAAFFMSRRSTQPRAAWDVASVEGAPTVGESRVTKSGKLAVGEWLETDARSRAEVSVADIGKVEVDPGTRLRIVETGPAEHRVELAHGRLSAHIFAPPRIFFVDTPSAVAADLGCAYTLEVDDAGRSLLHVTSGWVALEAKGRESVVPSGASCATRPGAGPGTPFFPDATDAFKDALSRFDFGGDANALSSVLREARPRDTITLWHLLARTAGPDRARVYERLAQFAPPPRGVTRDGALSLDPQMLEAWKGALEENCFDVKCSYIRGAWHNVRGWVRNVTGR